MKYHTQGKYPKSDFSYYTLGHLNLLLYLSFEQIHLPHVDESDWKNVDQDHTPCYAASDLDILFAQARAFQYSW